MIHSSINPQRPTIGLALGGGAIRGIAHVGVLQEFERAGIPIDYIAGTSAGAIIGALYASGVSLTSIVEQSRQLTWKDVFAPHPTFRSLLSGKPIVKVLEKHCRATQFEELRLPLTVVVSDFYTGEYTPISTGPLFPAVQASCSIPLLFPPVEISGRYYMDGGFSAIIPAGAVRQMGADIVVACDVNYNALPTIENPGNFLSLVIHLMFLVARRNIREAKRQANLTINVDVKGISLFAVNKIEELLERGRQAAAAILPELEQQHDLKAMKAERMEALSQVRFPKE